MNTQTEAFPMTFVVMDMEWNQPISYMPSSIDPKTLPGEIIEIGAVKLTVESETEFSLSSPISLLVRPTYYRIMNKQVSRVINRSTEDLKHGLPFTEAYRSFLKWCGEDYILCAWGDSDISILRANLKIHNLPVEINERFLDIQPLFGHVAENTSQQRSVAYAVDFYRIPQTNDFHSADKDAFYEAKILKEAMIDYFELSKKSGTEKMPQLRHFISNPNLTTQTRWKSRAFPTEKAAVEATISEKMSCPICGQPLETVIDWFTTGHTTLSLWQCSLHNSLSGKVRIKKTPAQEFYGSGQLRFVNGNAARYVREKWEEKLTGKCEQNCEQM